MERNVYFMVNCPKCSAQMDEEFTFCGRCGAYINSNQNIIIDGKKNNRIRRFMNKNLSSRKRTIIFLLIWLIVAAAAIFITYDGVKNVMALSRELSKCIGQLLAKFKYIKEGLSLKYISKELIFMVDYVSEWIYLINGAIIFLLSMFFIWYYCYNFAVRMKFKELYPYRKPLVLNKIYIIISKAAIVISVLFILTVLISTILKFIIGVL